MAGETNGASGPSAGSAAPNGAAKAQPGSLAGPAANEDTETAANDNQETKAKEAYRFRAKLKVDGKDEDVDLSEDDIKERLQRQRAYERREKQYRDGLAEIDRVKQALAHLQADPLQVMASLGVDRRALAERILQQEAQDAALTPEQRAIAEREARIAELEAQVRQREDDHQKTQQQQMDEMVWRESQPRIVEAMRAAQMPQTPEAIRMYAVVAKEWLARGYDAPESVIAKDAADRLRAMSQGYHRSLTPEQLVGLLGDESLKKLTTYLIERGQAGRVKRAAPQPAASTNTERREESPYVDEAEFRRRAGL